MAFSELIKNFDNVRDYMREFYVYGFKSREMYAEKSSRSYDDTRRRIESWLDGHMSFNTTSDGKNVFISIDSRKVESNPLFKAWKSKSFTTGDITLHFLLMDILAKGKELTLKEIMTSLDEYSKGFAEPKIFDESTVRKKLSEYIDEGIIFSRKEGRTVYYKRAEEYDLPSPDLLRFYSEIMPCGVIGSFIEDKKMPVKSVFAFKHHYITSVLDSEILCEIFCAMQEKRMIRVKSYNARKRSTKESVVIPIRVMISSQSGRQHLACFSIEDEGFVSIRIDKIKRIETLDVCDFFDETRKKFDSMSEHMWGVGLSRHTEHVEFDIRYHDYEGFIKQRLEREKRCGKVTEIEDGLIRYEADVYDASELMPWIRTFIGRIVRIEFSNEELQNRFVNDIKAMAAMYGGKDDIQ